VKDSSMQTEPMVVFGMQQKVTAPGISVVVPQNYHLSPDVRMPLTLGQPNALTLPPLSAPGSVNISTLTPNIISLPPAITFPTGYPPSFVNPLPVSTSINSQSGVSMLRPPLLAAANTAHVPNSVTADAASRKRKLDTDAGFMADVSVQTTGKSHVKKMKMRMGPFTASEFKVIGKDGSVLSRNQQSLANNQGSPTDSETWTGAKTQTDEGGTTSANITTSPAGQSGLKKDVETPAEKKYTTVWKLLEDSSDDESSACELMSASQDVPVSAAMLENSISQLTSSYVVPSSTELTTHHLSEKTDSVAAPPQTPTQVKDGDVVHDNGHHMEDDDEDKLVIDTHVDTDSQQSQLNNKQSNDWEFRNGMKETELADDEKEVNKPTDGEEQDAASEVKTDKKDDDGIGKSSTATTDVECPSTGDDAVETSKLTADATDSAVGDSMAPAEQAETANTELSPKPRRVYGKFEYTPTGEHILRCLVPKCSQTFDRKLAADVHSHVHPGFVPGTEGSEGPTYLQCHQCEFQAPFYHWYDLLRHMRQKHDISLTDSSMEHTCEYCGLGFETKDLLVSHIDFHYSNRYKCIYCGLLLLTWAQVRASLMALKVVDGIATYDLAVKS